MNIKSLLLGSAAALVAVSGARAADAIVAVEPEPVEYVRVCDAFGTGYFYIPGTETCLRIHGYVRYDINGGELLDVVSGTGDETWRKRARMSFRVSTASETELGTLRTYVETRWQYDTNQQATGYTNDSEFSVNFAWIQLGGLRVGKDESFFTTWTGYGAGVINDTLTGGYGPFDTNLISYTYNSGNFRAGISLEEGVDNVNFGGAIAGWGIDDYMPHVVVGLGATFGMVDLSGVFAYDTRDDFGGFEYGGWAAKIRADFQLSDAASVFVMGLYGENSSGYTTWANGLDDNDSLSVMVGGAYAFTDRATFNLQAQWVEGNDGWDDAWSVVGNVAYELVPGLTITPELAYASAENSVFAGGQDEFGGTLRFQRSF